MTVPYTFASASSPIPLSELDANFDAVSNSSNQSYTSSLSEDTRTVQSKLSDWVSVLDFGADPTGNTDSTSAIQAAINSIVATGIPSTLLFPSGTYKCTSTITVNCGYVSMFGERAILSFTTIGNIPALTFVSGNDYTGNPWNQADFRFQGFTIIGPAQGTGVGLYLNELTTGSNGGPSHTAFSDFHILNFKYGIMFGNHTYLCTFGHFDIYNVTTGIYYPENDLAGNVITDSGENISFYNGTTYGISQYDFYCENSAASSDFTFVSCSFDGSGTAQVYNNTGEIVFTGCHFEGSASRSIVQYNQGGHITINGGYMIDNGNKSLTGYIYNQGYMTIVGTRIASYGRPNIIYSDQRFTMFGAQIQTDQSASGWFVLSGNYLYYEPNLGSLITNGNISSSGAVSSSYFAGPGVPVTISSLNTWTNLGFGTRSGMWVFRDSTSGGVALFIGDSSVGAQQVSNSITGFQMRFNGSILDYQIQVTSGAAPRNITPTFLQVLSG